MITQDSCTTHREISRMAPLLRLMSRLKWTDEHITVVENILNELIKYLANYLFPIFPSSSCAVELKKSI